MENREQIINGLDCCTRGRKSKDDRPCLDCPYNECNIVGGTSERQITGTCQGWLMRDALALIKELTDEVAKAEADTVRKMHKRIKEDAISVSLLSNPPKFMLEIREDALDQIAKDMAEGTE